MNDDFANNFTSAWTTTVIVIAVVGFVLLACCFYFSMRGCRPSSQRSALIEVQAIRGEVIRPPNVVSHIVYTSAPGQPGQPGQDLVLVPRSLLEERGVPLPPSAYSQQYPPLAGNPHQVNMESLRQSSGAYVSQAQEQQQIPSTK